MEEGWKDIGKATRRVWHSCYHDALTHHIVYLRASYNFVFQFYGNGLSPSDKMLKGSEATKEIFGFGLTFPTRHHLFSCLHSVWQQRFPWITSIILWVSSQVISITFIICLQICCGFFLGKTKAFLLLPQLRPPADLHLTCGQVEYQQFPSVVLVTRLDLAGLVGCSEVCGVQTSITWELVRNAIFCALLGCLASESLGVGPRNLFFFFSALLRYNWPRNLMLLTDSPDNSYSRNTVFVLQVGFSISLT